MTQRQIKQLLIALTFAIGLLLWSTMIHAQLLWTYPEEGISKTTVDKNIWVFKIDQKEYTFKAVGNQDNIKTLPEWAKWYDGGINLNMWGLGYLPMGYTKINNKVIQPEIRKDYNGFIVWNKDTLLILDKYKDGLEAIMKWPNISQNIRTIIEEGKRNRWQIDQKKWSVAMLAVTTDGYVLFIHSREPYTMHNFIDILLNHKELKIYRAVYLEGGPESSIAIYGHFSRPLKPHQLGNQRMGSYETGYYEYYDNTKFQNIPWALVFY